MLMYDYVMVEDNVILEKYKALHDFLDERGRRIWTVVEARSLQRGGVSQVARVIGVSRTTIHTGVKELKSGKIGAPASGRIRKKGAGRKPLLHHAPEIINALDALVEPTIRGDPESPLRWTCKSTRNLARELQREGYRIGDRKVADLLHQMRYSLQANVKTTEGAQHTDRNAQFEYINAQTKAFQSRNQPVISV